MPLSCWDMVPLYSLWWDFFHKWILNFVRCFFCVYWDDHVFFVFSFCNVIYHSDWLEYFESSLQPWDKSNLITMYGPFYVLLGSVCYFVEDFCIHIHQRYWPVTFFFSSVFYFDIRMMMVSQNEFECSFLLVFFKWFERNRYKFFVYLVEFPREAI